MVNGLGVLGWTVGTLEAEAVMFGHPLTFQLPKVIGIKLLGKMPLYATSTDAVLLITKELRKQLPTKEESLDMFVEFFGPAVDELSIADRSGKILFLKSIAKFTALIFDFFFSEEKMNYLCKYIFDFSCCQFMQ